MRIPPWLRWTLVAPVALLAGYVTWLLTTLAVGAVARACGLSLADGPGRAIVEALPHACSGAAFVLGGRALTLAGRRGAAVLVLLLALVLAGLVAFGVLAPPRGWQLVGAAAVMAGALLAAIPSGLPAARPAREPPRGAAGS